VGYCCLCECHHQCLLAAMPIPMFVAPPTPAAEEEHCCLAAQLSWHTRGGAVVTLGATSGDGRRVTPAARPAGRPTNRMRFAAFQPPGWRAPAAEQYEAAEAALGSASTGGAAGEGSRRRDTC
jgi:hypothetical protein